MSSSTTSSNATASRLPSFEKRMQDVKLSKQHINILVMDYLIREGYPKAAQKFASEANIHTEANVDAIQERVEIRNMIYAGEIEIAIGRINELNPQILDRDESLHFALMRLQLVELIRACTTSKTSDIGPALEFATTHLAPRAPTRPEFLRDLEQTMALLIFDPNALNPTLAGLLDPQLRKDVAQQVNAAILQSQGDRARSKLLELVKTRAWAERRARDAKKDIPERLDIGLDAEGGSNNKMDGSGEGVGGAQATARAGGGGAAASGLSQTTIEESPLFRTRSTSPGATRRLRDRLARSQAPGGDLSRWVAAMEADAPEREREMRERTERWRELRSRRNE